MRAVFWFFLAASSVLLGIEACSNKDAAEEINDTKVWEDPPDAPNPGPVQINAERLFPTKENPGTSFAGCMMASSLLYTKGDTTVILTSESGGTIAAIDPDTGQAKWTVLVPSPSGEDPFITATPALVGDRLVVSYHTTPTDEGRVSGSNSHSVGDYRLRHLVVVVDLQAHAIDGAFPQVELAAAKPGADGDEVKFRSDKSLGRGAILGGVPAGGTLGNVYITFGNARDLQPWHGWAFEINLDAWKEKGAAGAISGVLLTTPENECGDENSSGSGKRICGGGLWAPSGPLIVPTEDSYEVILPPGNGQLDLNRNDYANTLMRTGPGLSFDRACDETLCANYDSDSPSGECIESCKNLFIPRVLANQTYDKPPDGSCDGMTLYQCWGLMDYIGGSSPTWIGLKNGPDVLAYPGKDGFVYLVDYAHLGTMWDREQAAVMCGTADDRCRWNWAGMIVTQPTLTKVGGDQVILVPTFMPDNTHPAGVRAFRVVDSATPSLESLWTFPQPQTDEAVARFRRHPSRIVVAHNEALNEDVGWVVEAAEKNGIGRLIGLRVENGARLVDVLMAGPGYRFTTPVVYNNTIYVNSCASDDGRGVLEAYRITAAATRTQ